MIELQYVNSVGERAYFTPSGNKSIDEVTFERHMMMLELFRYEQRITLVEKHEYD